VFVAALVGLQIALGEPPDVTPPANTDPGAVQPALKAQYRQASHLIGMEVRNEGQERLGKIEDLAIDQNTGQVRYAVLSFDDAMGVGGKLLPMPWRALTIPQVALKPIPNSGTTEGIVPETYCVLKIDKDAIQKAPSFEKGQWPDFNDQKLAVAIADFYRPFIARQHGAMTH
jgi:sporulation protein YlmC with PRC-barrel domain